MAKVTHSNWERRHYIVSDAPYSGGMNVGQLVQFADTVRAEGAPMSASVVASFSNDTRHLVTLSVHWTDESKSDPEGYQIFSDHP
jgi:PKD repeat protein